MSKKALISVTLVPNEEEFACKCRRDDMGGKEAWEGWGPTKWRCDIARGHTKVNNFRHATFKMGKCNCARMAHSNLHVGQQGKLCCHPPPFHMEVPPANKMLENIGKHFANVKKLYFALVGQLAHESVLLGHLHHCTASSSCMYFEAAVEELVEH